MKFEDIKKVKLLVSLKGTDENGKQLVWLAGTVFDKDVKSFPPAIIEELNSGRPRIFEILETYPEEQKEQEKPKDASSKTEKPRLKRAV